MLCRTVKELRELVCLSRLDYHQPDNLEYSSSDSDDMCLLSPSLLPGCETERRLNQFINEGPSSSFTGTRTAPDKTVHSASSSTKKRSFKSTTSISKNPLSSVNSPVMKPLPATKASFNACKPLPNITNSLHQLDEMFQYVDMSTVQSLLMEAHQTVGKLSDFSRSVKNFVLFAHFWMSEMPGTDRAALMNMEYRILIDNLESIFVANCEVNAGHVRALAGFVFHEYPRHLLSSCGPHLVLNYIDTLTLSQHDETFRQLLSNIHCSTKNREQTEFLLGLRAFAVTSILSAFVNFYCNLMEIKVSSEDTSAECPLNLTLKTFYSQQRLFMAIQ